MRPLCVLLALAAGASITCKTEPDVTGSSRGKIEVQILPTEPGASRLLLAPGGRRAAIERAGSSEVVAVPSAALEATAAGPPIGPPAEDGALVYLERSDRGKWQVRSTADAQWVVPLEPPGGDWRLEIALGAGDRRVAVFAAPAERWIASLGDDSGLRADTRVEGEPVGPGPTVALSPGGDRLYLLSKSGDTYGVTALAMGTLAPVWTTRLEPPPRPAPDSVQADGPGIQVEIGPWGDRPGFLIQPSGDGSGLLVVAGESVHGAIAEPPILLILEAATGRVTSARRFRPEGPFIGQVRAAAPVPSTSQVVLLHVSRFREGAAESPSVRFGGLSRFDLSAAGDPDVYLVSREADAEMKAMIPSALAVMRDGRVLVAP